MKKNLKSGQNMEMGPLCTFRTYDLGKNQLIQVAK